MRLFQYISGSNEAKQKIAMTTPGLIEGELGKSDVSMGFVMPKEVAAAEAPDPKGRTRKGGREREKGSGADQEPNWGFRRVFAGDRGVFGLTPNQVASPFSQPTFRLQTDSFGSGFS